MIEYDTSSSSIDYLSELTSYLSEFFHIPFVDGWQEQVMPLDVHVIDKGTFSIDDDNLEKIQAANCDPT